MLRDRHAERQKLDRLLETVRAGESRALVVRGPLGVGKTALLEYLAEQSAGFRLERATGVQSEMELAFASLHQLCAPMLDQDEQLPAPQRDALRTAFGLSSGPAPDRFLVGLAVLGLMAEVAREQPLVCVVDDAQWLDRASAQALAFVARRLVAESVALVFATRDTDGVAELAGLAQMELAGLPDGDALGLLSSALRGPMDRQVLERIVAETRGNPLALLELPRGLTPAKLAGGFGLPGAWALEGRIEEKYVHRLTPLPPQTRQLLLIAAADPLGDPVLVWRAAERLEIAAEAAAPAAAAGLLQIGARVQFHHPLVRSAIYRAASPEERRIAHRALARATDSVVDPDRRAWHRAQAEPGPDEEVAAELESSAGRALARGGLAAAASFLERAAELTPDPVRRAQRSLDAAQAMHQAGDPDAAQSLLSLAEAGPLDKLSCARVDLLRGQIAFAARRGSDASSLLLNAANQLESLDVGLARETYLDALLAALFAGPLDSGAVREAADAARAAPPPPQPARAVDLLLDGLAMRLTDGYAAGAPLLRRALGAFRGPDLSREEGLRWLFLASRTAGDLWDHETSEILAARHVRLARDSGALTVLPLALISRMVVHVFAGELAEAVALVEEAGTVTATVGNPFAPYIALLPAWQGREAEAIEAIEATTKEALHHGEGVALGIAGWAEALLCNSLGRYDEALTVAEHAAEHAPAIGVVPWGILVELIEAATRSEMPAHATHALEHLSTTTTASGTEWALGIEARCRALLSDGIEAETSYCEAIDRLGRSGVRGELARAHLLYGEWLRRERRRIDARTQLRTAHDMFTTMGAEAFAQRAARELLATGETARRRTADTSSDLTAQELQIVRLVRDGLTNTEVSARLFISPRTVEWHLSKIFSKLNITSRRQL